MTQSAELRVIVCKGPSCSLMNGSQLVQWCEQLKAAGLPIEHKISGCTGNCKEAPVVQWNGRYLTECTPEQLTERLIKDDLL